MARLDIQESKTALTAQFELFERILWKIETFLFKHYFFVILVMAAQSAAFISVSLL
jgi:hypothetical protein